jgi:hypothetical protein
MVSVPGTTPYQPVQKPSFLATVRSTASHFILAQLVTKRLAISRAGNSTSSFIPFRKLLLESPLDKPFLHSILSCRRIPNLAYVRPTR